jgi:putative ABC transport system substrate-binding protein
VLYLRPGKIFRIADWSALAVAVIAVLAFAAAETGGQDQEPRLCLLVLSGEASPYMQAKAGANKRLTQAGYQTKVVQLKELSDDALQGHRQAGYRKIITIGSAAAISLKKRRNADETIYYCLVTDPKGKGLRDDTRIHGVSMDVDLAFQRSLIARALPRARRVGLLYRGSSEVSVATMRAAVAAVPTRWQVMAIDVDKYESKSRAIAALFDAQIDVVWTVADTQVYDGATARAVLLAGLRKRVPVFGFSPQVVRAGALIGVGVHATDQGQACGDLVVRMDRGETKPPQGGGLLIDPRPRTAVNVAIAKRLGITLDKDLIKQADHVFGRE